MNTDTFYNFYVPAVDASNNASSKSNTISVIADKTSPDVEKWGMYEQSFTGPLSGNPYQDVSLLVTFTHESSGAQHTVSGFWDGGDVFRVRFMPTSGDDWTYETSSNTSKLNGITGSFTADNPSGENHGPIIIDPDSQYHFTYADGSRYYPFGTTTYGLAQPEEMKYQHSLNEYDTYGKRDGTLPFNKVRMCATEHAPTSDLDPENDDFRDDSAETVFVDNAAKDEINPKWFQLVDRAIEDLKSRNMQAQLILQHSFAEPDPDSYSTSEMDKIIEYMVARYGAYRNVQWCLSNEWDLTNISASRWREIGNNIRNHEHVRHIATIHSSDENPKDHWDDDWCSYICIQGDIDTSDSHPDKIRDWRSNYNKPIVNDEFGYEGDQGFSWEVDKIEDGVRGFWRMMLGGGYASHGETYSPQFFRGGGSMSAKSTERVAFMRRIYNQSQANRGLEPISGNLNGVSKGEKYYLFYYGTDTPTSKTYDMPTGNTYQLQVIDTWDMKIDSRGKFSGNFIISLPGDPYMAVRMALV